MEWVQKCQSAGVFAIDTETNSLDAMQAKLVGLSLATQAGEAAYIPINHEQDLLAEKNNQLPLETIWKHLKPLLKDPALMKVGHNIKYDKLVLKKYDIDIYPYEDTMLLSYLLAPGPHNLNELAKRHFDHTMISFKEVIGTSKRIKTFDQVNITDATNYAAEDADYTLRLYSLLKPQIFEEKMTSIYEVIDRPLVDTLVKIEENGFKIDPKILKILSQEFGQNLKEYEKEIYDLAEQEFNIGSPKQLGEILFDKLKLGEGKKGKSGYYETGVKVLENLAIDHTLPDLILKWRQMSKLINTYTEALASNINPTTGRVHTSFSMATTSTGRLASSEPNLQNIPIRTAEGRKIRHAFIADKGMKLVSLDYSQIELRLLAHFADIKELKEAFLHGQDIHALTASQVFGIPLKDITSEIRSRAKAINFGIIYGISAFGLARQLGIGRESARDYIKAYHAQYPGIQKYMDEMVGCARSHGYVKTISGRRCYVPNIHSKNGALRGFAERQAINAPLQGSNADIIKKAMNLAEKVLKENNLKSKLLLQVHDELIFESPENQVEETITTMTNLMENIYKISIPLKVDSGVGNNWAEAH
jgi:DNA polymerase-1